AMLLTKRYEMKTMWRGEYVAVTDAELCTRCGKCGRACPFSAIEKVPDGTYQPVAESCWGCGVCRSHCASAAISLVDRRKIPAVATLW
ncbi:MAG: 4Fe-4S dicluster domain-containing protein, partial [Actinobacteria bacterium]